MQQHLAIHTKGREHILSRARQSDLNDAIDEIDATADDAICRGALDRAGRSAPSSRGNRRELTVDDVLEVAGWAAARGPDGPFDALYFVIDHARWLPVAYGLAREDAAALRPDGALRQTGFNERLPMRHMTLGNHTLTVVGVRRSRYQYMARQIAFTVLARPERIETVETPTIERPGRVRVLRDTSARPRDDGRSDAAVRPGASLVIGGWTLAADGASAPDSIRVVLVGRQFSYRVAAARGVETEAGLDGAALDAGYATWMDCTAIRPGLYDVIVETCSAGTWTAVPTRRLVEIMPADEHWIPAALPTYARRLATTFDTQLPASISQGTPFLIRGTLIDPEPILGIFMRFDGEQAFGLTTSVDPNTPGTQFAGLALPRLACGDHLFEIVALDHAGSGVYELAATTLRVEAYALDRCRGDANLSRAEMSPPW